MVREDPLRPLAAGMPIRGVRGGQQTVQRGQDAGFQGHRVVAAFQDEQKPVFADIPGELFEHVGRPAGYS